MQDYYYTLTVRPSSHRELFRDFLIDTLPIGFEEIEEGFLVRSEDSLETIGWGLEQFAEALGKALGEDLSVDLEYEKLKNDDWVRRYQESVTPIEIGEFYIHPTWDAPREGKRNIAIDPALAFGTGHHPTTASCLEAIERHVHDGDEVVDIGCGSGILAIAALKKGAIVDACDTDAVSIANAKENAALNGVAFRNIWEGSATQAPSRYDVVVANIVADVLTMIASDLKRIRKSGGILILSGILDKYEQKVMNKYSDLYIKERIVRDEWVTLVLEGTKIDEQ